jgi:hypothetical protein
MTIEKDNDVVESASLNGSAGLREVVGGGTASGRSCYLAGSRGFGDSREPFSIVLKIAFTSWCILSMSTIGSLP